MNTPPNPAQQAPQKKGCSGCLLVLAILAGFAIAGALVIGVFAYRFATTEEGKALVSTVGEGVKIMSEAQNAPGAKEIRDVGCTQALVVDVERMGKLMDAGGDAVGEFSKVITCQVGLLGTAPTCDQLAKTYVHAAGKPPRGFMVTVTHQRHPQKPTCMKLYSPSGTKVRDLER